MTKWPKSTPWKGGKRKDWLFESGYELNAFKYPGSKGFDENKWEILISFQGEPSDPPPALIENVLDDYIKYQVGRYGYFHDPDIDRIVRMITLIK